MKIFVISMATDHERRAKLKTAFPKHFDDFIFINAVDGRTLTSDDYFKLIRPNLYKYNRLLSPAEVGCALSHMQVLEMIVADNAPAIVLEDDVLGNDDHLEIAKKIEHIIQKNDVIFLGGYDHIKEANEIYLQKSEALQQSLSHPIYEIDKHSHIYLGGACCFAIGVGAAKEILAKQNEVLKLSDNWYRHALNTNIQFKFTQLLRHPKLEDTTNYSSNLEGQRSSLKYKKTHVLFRESVFLNIKLQQFNLSNLFKKTLSRNVKTLNELLNQ